LREADSNRREVVKVTFFDRDLIAGAGLTITTGLITFVFEGRKSTLTFSILDPIAVFMTLARGTLGLIFIANFFVLKSRNWKWLHIAVTNRVLVDGLLVFVW
jgi:hypothetical protein